MSNGVKSWSFSAWELYDQCPQKFKYIKIDKMKEPQSPHLIRGNLAHKAMEDYLTGAVEEVPHEGEKFAELLPALRDLDPYVEQEWAFKKDWSDTHWRDWANCWVRIKTDVCVVYPEEDEGEIIDHKTGKTKAKEHQLELYALAGMLKFPKVKNWRLRFWYLDSGDEVVIERNKTTRDRIKHEWLQRIEPMFNDTIFAPSPGPLCRFCHFRKSNGGPCEHA